MANYNIPDTLIEDAIKRIGKNSTMKLDNLARNIYSGSMATVTPGTACAFFAWEERDDDPKLPIDGIEVEAFKEDLSEHHFTGYDVYVAKKVLKKDPDEYLRRHGISPDSEKGKKLIAASVAIRMGIK